MPTHRASHGRPPSLPTATEALALAHLAQAIADRSVIADIECECGAPELLPHSPFRWYDTRPMLNPHEHCNTIIDWNREVLAYAHGRGLIAVHPQQAHLVRITPRPTPALFLPHPKGSHAR